MLCNEANVPRFFRTGSLAPQSAKAKHRTFPQGKTEILCTDEGLKPLPALVDGVSDLSNARLSS